MIDELVSYNREFVKNKGYEKYITNKYPDKKIAIVSCMDTRSYPTPSEALSGA